MSDSPNTFSSFIPAVFVVLILVVLGAGLLFLSQNNTSSLQTNPTQTLSPTESATNNKINSNNITLDISQPKDRAVVNTPTIKVIGTTVPGADVSVNNQDLTADTQGKFMAAVTLEDGDNYIDITVNDQSGQSAQKEIMVTYQQP